MPPLTLRSRSKTSKASKENIGVVLKTKSKTIADINSKINIAAKGTDKKKDIAAIPDSNPRPRRERKLPNRYNQNEVLTNLSNVNESNTSTDRENVTTKPVCDSMASSPFKTPQKDTENSLIPNRPRRLCRLPSKFDDHSISPNKFIPVGCHASTPIDKSKNIKQLAIEDKKVAANKATITNKQKQTKLDTKKSPIKRPVDMPASSDTNNNGKRLRTKKLDSKNNILALPEKVSSPAKKKTSGRKLLEKSFSFRVLEDKEKPTKRDNSHLDIYEFTYDPNEEPPPQKKKRKRTTKKNPPKPKTVVLKSNYDQNVSKAMAALKNVVAKKSTESHSYQPINSVIKQVTEQSTPLNTNKQTLSDVAKPPVPVITVTSENLSTAAPSYSQTKPSASTRAEDIAADFVPLMDHNDMNYSPVTSPNRCQTPILDDTLHRQTNPHDPLNLQDNLSFFDDIPAASSSMNTSVRRPHASPWRVQFEQLPIKWQVNTYIKPNMTPAVESSFINFNDTIKKKHVYTDLVPESNDALPEIVGKDQPNLKQTCISFIKEVVERSASKKKRALSVTPRKGYCVFDDLSNMPAATIGGMYRTPNKTPRREPSANYWTPNKVQEENVNRTAEKNKKSNTPKSSRKDKDGTYFGFDDSEDQENVSPVKIDNPRVRALRPRARAVLQEINAQSGPSRAKVPLAAKSNIVASSDAVKRVYEEMKSATDAPVFPEKNANTVNDAVTNAEQTIQDEDSQSVHLFEDIELIHHLKPLRKSYGKAKKVTFQQTVASDSDSQSLDAPPPRDEESSEEDDLTDLTFIMPNVPQKHAAKKKDKENRKEKVEMEAWAAQFNSMCEDVEKFPLVVE